MNKAVVGVFADNISASRAINDLKAFGFGGETINQVLREDLTRGQRLPGPRIVPAMEVLKGLIVGIVAGAIFGAIAAWFLGMALTWPSFGFASPPYSAILTFAAVGAICGMLEGLAAVGPLAAARRALLMRHRGDAVVTVHTDETHAVRAADILRAAGASDVRRGASSVAEEFRTVESVQPEMYGTTNVIQREPVDAPAATGEVMGTPPGGGNLG
ncbi:MAG TPA: hypothetical protein VMW62_10450 [Chloroflexota bacterium]|nr:hypothetical protein [Chloroflexota bacterium]